VERIYLALGSNLGDREENLRAAVQMLQEKEILVRRISPVYETPAVYYEAQPDFLNCVLEAETSLPPAGLLSRTQEVESRLGRERVIPKGPRSIDIDVLLYGDRVIDEPGLQVPHPRMDERRFVLEPFADLAPELRHPVHGRTIREMLAEARYPASTRRTSITLVA